jgi:hypothetical protein
VRPFRLDAANGEHALVTVEVAALGQGCFERP